MKAWWYLHSLALSKLIVSLLLAVAIIPMANWTLAVQNNATPPGDELRLVLLLSIVCLMFTFWGSFFGMLVFAVGDIPWGTTTNLRGTTTNLLTSITNQHIKILLVTPLLLTGVLMLVAMYFLVKQLMIQFLACLSMYSAMFLIWDVLINLNLKNEIQAHDPNPNFDIHKNYTTDLLGVDLCTFLGTTAILVLLFCFSGYTECETIRQHYLCLGAAIFQAVFTGIFVLGKSLKAAWSTPERLNDQQLTGAKNE